MVALRAAAARLDNYRLLGTTLYVTLDPARCARARWSMPGSSGSSTPRPIRARARRQHFNVTQNPALNHRLEVVPGVLAEECGPLLRNFFLARRG